MWKQSLIASIVTVFIGIVIFIVWISTGSFKPLWEINNRELNKLELTSNCVAIMDTRVYDEITASDFGIVCGNTTVHLGDLIDPNDFIIKDRVINEEDDSVRYYLQAQSKRYELIGVSVNGICRVYKIRTTNVGVSGSRGQTIAQTFDTVNGLFNDSLSHRRRVKVFNKDKTMVMRMQFASGILCEIAMEYEV